MKKTAVFSGREVYEYTIANSNGMKVTVLNYGGTITGIYLPGPAGEAVNAVLAYDNYEDYKKNPYYFGSIIGRTAGRTPGARFKAGGKMYDVKKNEGNNHLHGGGKGLAHTFFEVNKKGSSLELSCHSQDGEDGYPGNLNLTVTYTLTSENELIINYEAESDKETPLNLTNHTYFLLGGDTVRDHELVLNSSTFYELDEESLPQHPVSVKDSQVFDFCSGKQLQKVFQSSDPQAEAAGGGVDHPFVLDESFPAGELFHPDSGRKLTVETDQPAVVIYTGNSIDSKTSVNGKPGEKYGGICFETQEVPGQTEKMILKPGETYKQRTVFRFEFPEGSS